MNPPVQDPAPAGARAALGSHPHATGSSADGPPEAGAGSAVRRARRSRWLVPAVAAVALVLGLVLAGIVPLSTVIYAGLFGGMILMHIGGHGHGGHGHAVGREAARPTEAAAERSDAADLREPSADAQRRPIRSTRTLDRRAAHTHTLGETNEHGEHPSRCCH